MLMLLSVHIVSQFHVFSVSFVSKNAADSACFDGFSSFRDMKNEISKQNRRFVNILL